jgi:hypothetical protein
MRVCSLCFLLSALLALLCCVQALDDIPAPMQQLPTDPTEDGGKPKLFRPNKGFHKEDHEVDPGNQRARADREIEENAEGNQRVVNSIDDLR